MNEKNAESRMPLALALLAAVTAALVLWTSERLLGSFVLFASAWVTALALPPGPASRAFRAVLAVVLLLWILHEARWVVYPLVAGTLTAYAAAPAVQWLEGRRLRRPAAAALALLPFAALAILALVLLIPALIHQLQLLTAKLPSAYASLEGSLSRWQQRFPLEAVAPPAALDSAVADSTAALPGAPPETSSLAGQLFRQTETLLRTALGGLVGVGRGLGRATQVLGLIFLTPVVAYHLLVDWEALGDAVLRWWPERWHSWTHRVTSELKGSLLIYLRGQALVAGIEAILFALVFWIAGFPQPIALGFLAGLFSLVPILGFWLTLLLAVLNAVTGPALWPALIKAGSGLLVINVLEGQLLVPRIQGSGLGLHPLAVLLGVLLFGTLFGFVGILLAVPVLGVLRAIFPELLAAWRATETFRGRTKDQTD